MNVEDAKAILMASLNRLTTPGISISKQLRTLRAGLSKPANERRCMAFRSWGSRPRSPRFSMTCNHEATCGREAGHTQRSDTQQHEGDFRSRTGRPRIARAAPGKECGISIRCGREAGHASNGHETVRPYHSGWRKIA